MGPAGYGLIASTIPRRVKLLKPELVCHFSRQMDPDCWSWRIDPGWNSMPRERPFCPA